MKPHRLLVSLIMAIAVGGVAAQAQEPATPARPLAGGVVAIWVGGPNVDREAILKMPVVKGGQVVVQWAEIESDKGKYDFSALDKQLAEFARRGMPVTVQLNGNRKPRYLFNEVPYVKETSRDVPAFRQVQDREGTLMYWHPANERAYVNCLVAFRDHLVKSPYKKSIIGLRMNFNPFGTEGVAIYPEGKAKEYTDKKRWIQPPGLDKSIPYEGYNKKDTLAYVRRIMGKHIELFGSEIPMFVRCTEDSEVFDAYASHVEKGEFGLFVTGSCCSAFGTKMEKIEARLIKYCRPGKAVGYAESFSDSWGFHGIVDKLILPPPQEFYWRVLCDLHKGVSYVACYGKDLQVALTGTYKLDSRTVDGKPIKLNYSDKESGFDYKREFSETLALADKYAGYHAKPQQAPGAWVAFRQDDRFSDGRQKQRLKLPELIGDYTYLMERLPDQTTGITGVGPDHVRFGGYARQLPASGTMRLKVDERFVKSLKGPCRLSVTYFDDAPDTALRIAAGGKNWSAPLRGGKTWRTAVFEATEADFAPATDGANIVIQNGATPVCLHMVAIERK